MASIVGEGRFEERCDDAKNKIQQVLGTGRIECFRSANNSNETRRPGFFTRS